MKKMICFDVDGVLVNSDDAINVSSWMEYNEWLASLGLPHSKTTTNAKDIPDSWLNKRKLYSKYVNKVYHRTAINPLLLCNFDHEAITPEIIETICNIDLAKKNETIERINRIRTDLLCHPDYNDLVKSYSNLDYNWIKEEHDRRDLFFITNNPFSIGSFAQIAFEPNEDQVFSSKGGIHDKAVHIMNLAKTTAPENILFIDDSVNSLLEVAAGTTLLKKNIIQNNWAKRKNKHGFPILNFDEIRSDLMIYSCLRDLKATPKIK